MAKANAKPTVLSYAELTTWQVVQTFLVGMVVGLVAWVLAKVAAVYVFDQVLCSEGANLERCANVGVYAEATGLILAGLLGLFMLVRVAIYRPLVVVIASLLALWGVITLTAALPAVAAVLAVTLLFGIAFLVFTWVARLQSLILGLVFAAIVIVATRLILSA